MDAEKFFRAVLPFRRWLRAPRDLAYLLLLFRQKGRRPSLASTFSITDVRAYFINLDSRPDRLSEFEQGIATYSLIRPSRFSAFKRSPGILGANLSHSALLEIASSSRRPFLILEDDAEFFCEEIDLYDVIEEFLSSPRLDVLVLIPSLYGIAIPISEKLSIANNIRTAAAYIVKPAAVEPLMRRFSKTSEALETGVSPRRASFDKEWEWEQKHRLLFAVPRKKIGRQRPSFSDLQNKIVDYG